jgi:glycosyltransferase involved in cell wall biosynthesis
MHIVINARLLIKDKLDGIGWFTYQTIKRMVTKHPEHRFTLVFDRKFPQEFLFADNVEGVVLFPPARHPLLYVWYFEVSLKRYLLKTKPDLFVSTDGFLVLHPSIKQLAVIHDINFYHHPNDLKIAFRHYYNFFFPKFAKIAKRIATVSEYSKSDIAKTYRINDSKIDVVYNGINEGYTPIGLNEKQSIRLKYTHGKPYFLFVGSQSPRKNLNRLIKAFGIFSELHQKEYFLVLAGSSFWGDDELRKTYEASKVKDRIIFTGRLSQEELTKVVASAFALTFMPYYEGFGIPMIEAMASAVPVIAANTSCLPEIAGDAALYANPYIESDMADAMLQLANDEKLYHSLIQKGLVRTEKYSWDKTGDLLWQSIEKCF